MNEVELFLSWQRSPAKWVVDMFGLKIQPLKEGYAIGVNTKLEDIKADWFGPWEKGMVTWQQHVCLLAVERAVAGGKKFISISSGRGIGKSTFLSWLLLWGLFCYKGAQIPCTANTVQQLYDVLWKEVSIWCRKLPDWVRGKYILEKDYVRFEDEPGSGRDWFARAATAKKENPEALSGVHSPTLVMCLVDEASGVADEVFNIGEGSMTNKNVLMVLISNYTRRDGYFHRSQINENEDGSPANFQVLSFNGEESPLVEADFLERGKRKEGGISGDWYRVHVLGLPPRKGEEDDDGWINLFEDVHYTIDSGMTQPRIMGVDPGGLGRNDTAIAVRDPFKIKPIGAWNHLKPMEIMEKVVKVQEEEKVSNDNIIVDGFGEGVRVAQEAMNTKRQFQTILVGEPSKENKRFANLKAEMYWRMREWSMNGGMFIGTDKQWKALKSVFYRFDKFGRIEIMGKRDMRKRKIKGLDQVEAGMLTFLKPQDQWTHESLEEKEVEEPFDRFSVL